MAYSRYKIALFIRITILFLLLTVLAFALCNLNFKTNLPLVVITLVPIIVILFLSVRNLFRFTIRRFLEMDDFFESAKYRDFSRWFSEDYGTEDIRRLHKGFNEINKTIKAINNEKEIQHLYLKKILELVDTGIVAYNVETGKVLWINESIKIILNVPSLKNISFIEKRKPALYTTIFETDYAKGSTISIDAGNSKIKILISSSLFLIEGEVFKLIVLQNIDTTLSQTESDACKKLLSVMTHEIMNSIAPISSLADTLQSKVQSAIKDPVQYQLEMNDLDIGIESIKNRSEGLLKFAKTYRSLSKITKLKLEEVLVSSFFENICILMKPSLESKSIEFDFELSKSDLKIQADVHLIEQVLINLILNSVDACKNQEHPKIIMSAKKNIDSSITIKVVDNGMGISEEIIEDIFVPFFSTKKNGSGIGLSLCQQIMLLHKGKIQINSIAGEGTVINLIF